MAVNPHLNMSVLTSSLTDLVTYIGSGSHMIWYDGVQPANANTATGGNTAGASLACSATFGTVASNVLTANAITGATAGALLNPMTWFSIVTSGGSNRGLDGSAGTSAADLILNSATVGSGASCTCSSLTVTAAV